MRSSFAGVAVCALSILRVFDIALAAPVPAPATGLVDARSLHGRSEAISGNVTPASGGDVEEYCPSLLDLFSGNAADSGDTESGDANVAGDGDSAYSHDATMAPGGAIRYGKNCPLSVVKLFSGNAGEGGKSKTGSAAVGDKIVKGVHLMN